MGPLSASASAASATPSGRGELCRAAGRAAAGMMALLSLALAPSCLEDLREPRSCPPPARFEGADCFPALSNPPPGCFDAGHMACLSGPRSSCSCISDECPEPRDSCFPDGDCPPVIAEHVADASCRRLAPADFGGGLPSVFMCLCGCAGCAAVCDGQGPVMGMHVTDPGTNSPMFLVDLAGVMPPQGRLGIYLRLRGLARFAVAFAKQGPGGPGDLELLEAFTYFVITPLGTEFVEQLLFDDLLTDPYSWTQPDDRPVLMAIVPDVDEQDPTLALFEVDCVVPFVQPLP